MSKVLKQLTLLDLVMGIGDGRRSSGGVVDGDGGDAVFADRSGRNRLHHHRRDRGRGRRGRLVGQVLLVLYGDVVQLLLHLVVREDVVLKNIEALMTTERQQFKIKSLI